MLTLRFQRVGKKNKPFFRIVLTKKTVAPRGKSKEILGFYDPIKKDASFKTERIKYWLGQGVGVSHSLHNLLAAREIIEGAKKPAHSKRKRKGAEENAPSPEISGGGTPKSPAKETAPKKTETVSKESSETKPEDTKEPEKKEGEGG